MKHEFFWIDAFTDKKFSGNPCAVVFSADELSELQMLTVAKEMNLSETAFVVKSSIAQFGARYFTPLEEIPLAGHPTIATIRAFIESKQILLEKESTHVTLELKAGVVNIEILQSPSLPYQIIMAQNKPAFLKIHDPQTIASLFSLEETDLLPGYPLQTVSTGTPQLMVPVKNHSALKKASMNIEAYRKYRMVSDFFSPHLFCLNGATSEGTTFARHFGEPPDTAEDAFTGSATGGMAAYLWHYGLISKPKFIAEQGHWMGRPGQACVEVVGDPHTIQTVKVGGPAVIVMKGEIEI